MDTASSSIVNGDCIEVIPSVPDGCVSACITSPPYAMQRKMLYGGVSEAEYPAWTVGWMEALRPKLAEDGSVLIVIRPHVRDGQISDYVLRTRLALREAKWIECEELIWVKRDAPPLGSIARPRRCWESILWFAKSKAPFVNLKVLGNRMSDRIGGFFGSARFGAGNGRPVHDGQKALKKTGASRCIDVICADVGSIDEGVLHPAMYPGSLAQQLILMFSRKGNLVLDPFCGSGTTCIEAAKIGRRGLGIEISPEYAKIASARLGDTIPHMFSPDDQ